MFGDHISEGYNHEWLLVLVRRARTLNKHSLSLASWEQSNSGFRAHNSSQPAQKAYLHHTQNVPPLNGEDICWITSSDGGQRS